MAVPLWLLANRGSFVPGAYLPNWTWHAHEMVFGYAVAVIAGFLLTAVANWTGRETLVGGWLLALSLVWVAGRVAIFAADGLPAGVPAVVNLSFLPLLALALGRNLVATRNRRNYGFLGLLTALWLAQGSVHLSALGHLPGWNRWGSHVGAEVIIVVILVVSGRVVPLFTRNATRAEGIRPIPWLDTLTLAGMLAVVTLDVAEPGWKMTNGVALLTGLAAAARAWHWGGRHCGGRPILWVLHIGYAWIPIGLLLRAISGVEPRVPWFSATHALTLGAVGTLTLGMMARVALGHTGRTLEVARPIVWAFWLITLAALTRVVVPIVSPAAYTSAVNLAGLLWTAAFALFLLVYWPILSRPRADGKPG